MFIACVVLVSSIVVNLHPHCIIFVSLAVVVDSIRFISDSKVVRTIVVYCAEIFLFFFGYCV